MAKTRKIPLRKSVVSGEIIDKRDLLRIVKNKEGQVFIDPTGKANGRGAYIKLDNQEAALAKKKQVFNRAFGMEVTPEFYDELIAYVDHHDDAYAWAQRRRIEAHPTTGAIQIVEIRERVEEAMLPAAPQLPFPDAPVSALRLFAKLTEAELLSIGVPTDWLADVSTATEDSFLDIAAHLPGEAAEALLQGSCG